MPFPARSEPVRRCRSTAASTIVQSISGQSPVDAGWAQVHDQEQAKLYSDRELKAVPCDREAIIANARPEDHRGCGHPWHETVGDAASEPTGDAVSAVHRPTG